MTNGSSLSSNAPETVSDERDGNGLSKWCYERVMRVDREGVFLEKELKLRMKILYDYERLHLQR